MTTELTFTNSDIPSLNVLLRTHWTKKAKMQEALLWKVKQQTRNRHSGEVIVTFHRKACKLMDWDNFSGSFKLVGDSLVKAKLIVDDKPDIITSFIPLQTKVSKKADEIVLIKIEDKMAG